jgi:hypothetical protein
VDAELVAVIDEESGIKHRFATDSPASVEFSGPRANHIAMRRLVGGKGKWEVVEC